MNTVSLVGSVVADPPSFTLIGDTSGGPPVTNTWTRNGVEISDDGSYSISLAVNEVDRIDVFRPDFNDLILRESRYRSTLTVTGNLPGVYVYSVINRAMSEPRTDSITIEGGTVANLTAVQTGLTTVLIIWTAPPGPPAGGYQITVAGANNSVTGESPYAFTTSELGVHTVQVLYTSQHFPNEQAMPVMLTVNGIEAAIVTTSSLTATSVTISWSPQPAKFHLPVAEYTVSLTRVTGSGQALCTQVVDSRPAVTTTDTSMSFTGLEEFSSYTVTVTTTFDDVFSSNIDEVAEIMLTTPSAAPTGAPHDVIPSMTSKSIMVTWGEIQCVDRNGLITGYTVVFQVQGGANVSGNTVNRTFSAGLTPYTYYTFQVAGVNSNGAGPFSIVTIILTDEDVPGPVSDITAFPKFSSVDLTWSAPQEPNGVIISYEVTYRVGGNLITTNTTDLSTTFSISSLTPQTTVSNISISAYTSVGRGEAALVADQMTINIRAAIVTILSLTATSVTILWLPQPAKSVAEYTVSLTRVTGSGQALCTGVMDSRSVVTTTDTSMAFTGLEEFSTYTVTVTTTSNMLGSNIDVASDMMFTTPSAAPTGAPLNVILSITSRTITVTWTAIDCIQSKGVISCYTVVVQEVGGVDVLDDTVELTFNAEELTPGNSYTFQVAGVNDVGTGPFAMITFTTNEEAPGPVSNLTAGPEFTSVVLTWSVPQELNGVITAYEVTYSINGGALVVDTSTDMATTFTIPSLPPNTTVSDISVSAYTSIGRGPSVPHGDVVSPAELTLSMVTGVTVEQMIATSVRVSWDVIPVDGITGYTVYYSQTGNRKRQSEMSVTVDSPASSVDTDGLDSNVQYQFQVVALAEFQGETFEGERSDVTMIFVTSLDSTTADQEAGDRSNIIIGSNIIIAVVVTFFVTLLLFAIVMVVGCGIYYRYSAKTSRKYKMGVMMELNENAAYGHVISQNDQQVAPSDNSEAFYDIN